MGSRGTSAQEDRGAWAEQDMRCLGRLSDQKNGWVVDKGERLARAQQEKAGLLSVQFPQSVECVFLDLLHSQQGCRGHRLQSGGVVRRAQVSGVVRPVGIWH